MRKTFPTLSLPQNAAEGFFNQLQHNNKTIATASSRSGNHSFNL